MYKTMPLAESKVYVAKSAPQSYMQSICVILTAIDKISIHTEHYIGLLVIAELLVKGRNLL